MYCYINYMSPVHYPVSGGTAKDIADSLQNGIRTGGFVPDQALPSVRGLAEELAVAPGTVAAAYKLLGDRGFVVGRGRQGTVVRPRPSADSRSASAPVGPGVVDLASGQPAADLLPTIDPAGRTTGPAAAPDVLVRPELVAVARTRLTRDGVPADHLTVAGGGLDGIHRVLSAQLRPGDLVAVEDPGWPNALDLVAALRLRPWPMAVDESGPRPAALAAALRAGVRAVIVTSRAQNPTGAYVTAGRAAELRTVLAGHPETVVIEDDHAAELAGAELATLAGATRSWAFVRSTSKPYGPDLRLAVVAGDAATIAEVEARTAMTSGWVSTLLQGLVVQLWTDPAVAQTVRRAGLTYDLRRDGLLRALADRTITAIGATGINVWVPVPDETAVATRLLQDGWAIAPGARFRQASGPGVRITVSGLTEAAVPRLADDLAAALSGRRAGRPSS